MSALIIILPTVRVERLDGDPGVAGKRKKRKDVIVKFDRAAAKVDDDSEPPSAA